MRFGCRNDPRLAYIEPQLILFDESSYLMTDSSYCSYDNVSESRNNVFNLTSSFDNDNTLDDLSFVDLAVINIMNRNSAFVDDSAKVDLMKSAVNGLYEELSILKDQIVFLKADSNAKQSTISCLLNELSESRKRNIFDYPVSSDSSLYLKHLMNGQNSLETRDSYVSIDEDPSINDPVLETNSFPRENSASDTNSDECCLRQAMSMFLITSVYLHRKNASTKETSNTQLANVKLDRHKYLRYYCFHYSNRGYS